jgi:uncharacterized membrane protein YqhA
MLEKIFGYTLWKSRFIILSAVIFGIIGGFILFIVASLDIWNILLYVIDTIVSHAHPSKFHEKIVSAIIGAIDLYLIAVVMFIFSFGLYELFISDIDDATNSSLGDKILSIHSLDQLKDKIAKVVIMVLIVSFFQRMLYTQLSNALEMLFFALSITALSIAMYFLSKVGK